MWEWQFDTVTSNLSSSDIGMCHLHTFYRRMEKKLRRTTGICDSFTKGVMTRERTNFLFSFCNNREHTHKQNIHRTQYRSNDGEEVLLPVSRSLFIHRHHVHLSFLFRLITIIIIILSSTICHLISHLCFICRTSLLSILWRLVLCS